MATDPSEPNSETPFKIELAEEPVPSARRGAVPSPSLEPLLPRTPEPEEAEEEEAPAQPSPWHAVKKVVSRGYFDPFEAFSTKVDRERFLRSQAFLVVTSLVGPFALLLLFSFFVAVVCSLSAASHSVAPPNTFYEVTLYPTVFILAKGYWIAYLALPTSVLLLGWLWSAGTAWNLARDSQESFGRMFCILAMLGSMYAPFTTLPLFVKLVALLVLMVFVGKRMNSYFAVPFSLLAKRGGLFLLVAIGSYSFLEHQLESWFPDSAGIYTNIVSMVNKGKRLEWPSWRDKKPDPPFRALKEELGSMDPLVREKAYKRAVVALGQNYESMEARVGLAQRMADLGNTDGMIFLAKAYQTGQGVPQDATQALAWMSKAVEGNPKNLDYGMTVASLLIQNKRPLEGKRMFVALAKKNLTCLPKIAEFIRTAGFGNPDNNLTYEVQRLYQTDAYTSTTYRPPEYGGDGQYYPSIAEDPNRNRTYLLERLASVDREKTQWFYRALITEYGLTVPAEPEIYGEPPLDYSSDEVLGQIPKDDTFALGNAGDRLFEKGLVVKAREYWLKAVGSVDSDSRSRNARYYLKLAESYDAESDSSPRPNPTASTHEAVRYYLGFLLLADSPGGLKLKVHAALKRLGTPVAPEVNVQSPPFVALCVKYDVPEAWVMLGCEHMGDSAAGTARNLPKARECFEKAKSLGYRGPAVRMLNADPGAPPPRT